MIPRKPTVADPAAVDAFIFGGKTEAPAQPAQQEGTAPLAPVAAPVKVRKKPVRQKEKVLRQTFVINESLVDRVEAYAFWQRLTKKQVLEAALTQFFSDKKHRAIPRQELETEQV